jgi:hypothetical protein
MCGIGEIPQLDRAVRIAAGQRVPVAAERRRVDGRTCAGGADQELAERVGARWIGDIPQLDLAGVGEAGRDGEAADGQRVPIGTERHRIGGTAVGGEELAERTWVRGIGDGPQPGRVIRTAAGQHVSIGAEHYRCDAGGGASYHPTRPADQGLAERSRARGIGDIPQLDRAVRTAAGQRASVAAERHRVNGPGVGRHGCGQGRVFDVQQA